MLYALSPAEIEQLRRKAFRPEFAGAEMLFVAYRTDPGVVERILPAPLKPAPQPIGIAFVARYPQTNFGCVYNEGALFVMALHKGEPGLYCLAMPVDDDMAMVAGREILGYPKKMADRITLEKHGDTVVGSVVRKGTEILKIEAELSRAADASDLSSLEVFHARERDENGKPCRTSVSFLFKFFQNPARTGFDYIPRLVRQPNVLRPRGDVRRATACLVLTPSVFDPLADVPVVGAPLECVYGTWDNTMLAGRVVARTWNVGRFLPHAFFKTDMAPVFLGWATRADAQAARREHEPLLR